MSDVNTPLPAALTGNAVVDLQQLALVAVDGDDAVDFLQGQLTNDLREVTATRSQLSAWCSPRGRVLTDFLVFRHDGRLLLQLPQSLLQATLARLRMFVLRAKVTLEDVSASLMRLGLVGDGVESRLADLIGPLPAGSGESHTRNQVTCIRLHGPRPRYEIVGSAEALLALKNACLEIALDAGTEAWTLLNIASGIAEIEPATSDAFVPQMINLDRIGAVSFTKGCYVGQEIVARTQHLGRIKRRMYRAHLAGATPVGAGDTLKASTPATPFSAQVVNAAASPAGGFDVLAVMAIELARNLTPGLLDNGVTLDDGSQFTLQAPPYALEDETA